MTAVRILIVTTEYALSGAAESFGATYVLLIANEFLNDTFLADSERETAAYFAKHSSPHVQKAANLVE